MIYKNAAWLRELVLVIGILFLALLLRKQLLPIHSLDYNVFLSRWYDFIKSHGGIKALKYNFSNYNVPYLYLLVIATHLPLVKITAIKSISILFDFILAGFVYLIVRIKYEKSSLPVIAALIVLFLPTVFVNSSLWAQCDSIYTAFLLGGLYFLLCKKPFWAFIFFGVAFAFKLQAIFLFPLFFVLWMVGKIRLRYFLIIPFVYIISICPAYLLGRNFVDMLTIYLTQANYPPNPLSANAPNFFQLIPVPVQQLYPWSHVGVFLTLGVVLILSFIVLASKKKITNEIVLKLAFAFVLILPFFLPEMHQRYFYVADVFSLVYAFYLPKYFYIPILVQICSLESYTGFLMGSTLIGQQYLALIMLGVIALVIWDLMKTLWTFPEQPTVVLPIYSSLSATDRTKTGVF
jgi:Gpi18-like mannosyltransferase